MRGRQAITLDCWHSLMIAACFPFRLHQIRENVAYQRQVAAAFRFQPHEHAFVQTHKGQVADRSDAGCL